MTELRRVVAAALGVTPESLRDEIEFRSIPEWDSLGHVELMLALEEHLGVQIGPDLVTRLTSIGAIRRFARQPTDFGPSSAGGGVAGAGGQATGDALHRGLSGVLLDDTLVSSIDGEAGRLSYRGYTIDELVERSTFEETAYLLLHAELPTADELTAFRRRLAAAWRLPASLERLLLELRDVRPIDALRTALSAGGALDGPFADAELLIGRVAALVATHHALRTGARTAPSTDADAGHAERLLSVLVGRQPAPAEVRAFDRCLILLAEHGSNASAFAARVAIGTRADLSAALTAATSTFAGPLHGGAVEAVAAMVEQIGTPERAAEWVTAQRAEREPVFGFGHRIYRTEDPRAPHLRRMAGELSRTDEQRRALAIIEAVRGSMRERARHGVDVNVDLYAGLVFSALGLRTDLFMPIFAASRTAGWLAHALEQESRNVLIRPSLRYAGEKDRRYVPVAERRAGPPTGARAQPAIAAELPADARLATGFLLHAARSPNAPALRREERSLTYAELADLARRWAQALLEGSTRPPGRVAVLGARSEVSYGGTLASLLAGAAFVPLSPDMPVARSAHMLRAAQADALIVDRAGMAMLDELLAGVAVSLLLLLPEGEPDGGIGGAERVMGGAELRQVAPLTEPVEVAADETAYLLFTSGSTGVPKGVPISHANVVHFMRQAQARYRLGPHDRLSQTFQQTFDLSVFDLFMAWNAGACLCVPQPIDLLSPFRYVREHGLTVWFSVPSVATLLLRKGLLAPGSLAGLRWSLFCGEALPQATAEAWQAAAPDSIVENLYGPTECTIACTAYRWDPHVSPAHCVNGLVPIGRPWDGVDAVVVDDALQPVGAGQAGELLVGGAQTFAGYWHPAATERAFASVSGSAAAERYYRTGDRVVQSNDGDLAFVGRRDHQLQVMGHRVELGEVEAVLRAWPGVSEAVVVPWRPAAGSAEGLTAYVAGDGLDTALLGAQVQQRLPAYMAPRRIHLVEQFPLNANGKVDRRALQELVED